MHTVPQRSGRVITGHHTCLEAMPRFAVVASQTLLLAIVSGGLITSPSVHQVRLLSSASSHGAHSSPNAVPTLGKRSRSSVVMLRASDPGARDECGGLDTIALSSTDGIGRLARWRQRVGSACSSARRAMGKATSACLLFSALLIVPARGGVPAFGRAAQATTTVATPDATDEATQIADELMERGNTGSPIVLKVCCTPSSESASAALSLPRTG